MAIVFVLSLLRASYYFKKYFQVGSPLGQVRSEGTHAALGDPGQGPRKWLLDQFLHVRSRKMNNHSIKEGEDQDRVKKSPTQQ